LIGLPRTSADVLRCLIARSRQSDCGPDGDIRPLTSYREQNTRRSCVCPEWGAGGSVAVRARGFGPARVMAAANKDSLSKSEIH
jgi:hypothetical protein